MATIAETTLDANGAAAVRLTANGGTPDAYNTTHAIDGNGNAALRVVCEDGSIGGGSGGGDVSSVNGKKGDVVLTAADINATLTGDGNPVTATVSEHLQTLKNDEAALGTQVSGIEEKIPAKASSTNQLATMEDISGGSGGGDNNGLEGDYATRYGIVDETKSGLPTITTGNQVKIPAQLVLDVPGVPGLTTNASDIIYDIKSTTDCTLFLANGEVLEATDVFFQTAEPEDGTTGYAAWWNGTEWKFKSNDTGNVWRAANAVRIAKCIFTDGSLTRLCFTGCRLLNKQEYFGKEGGVLSGPIQAKTTAGLDILDSVGADALNISNIRVTSNKSICPSRDGIYSLGRPASKWWYVYAQVLNNGADIAIPTSGGTMVVATPPTAEGNYTLKATVAADGTVTTTWVKDA